ncbi:MAG: DUF5698 domain-containing protein [Puniceicoccaceae bacterium]
MGGLVTIARTVDVTIGTIRVISVIAGQIWTAFFLGFVEVLVWLSVISITLSKVQEHPVLMLFFALGFALGNMLGITVERFLPMGNLTLRIIGGEQVREIATALRDLGLGATVMKGEGRDGERFFLFSFMSKKQLKEVRAILEPYRDSVFLTLDYGGSSNRVLLPSHAQAVNAARATKRK